MTPTDVTPEASANQGFAAQRHYVESVESSEFDFGITVGDAFVRGIRDIGYRHTGTALDELIDNAIQAGARHVDVLFGFGLGSQAKPHQIAVVDDGHGMVPTMVRLSCIWGGTHREGDRTGFGRYGYGLPSSCVSQGRAFTVFSKTADGEWHSVRLDLDDIRDGRLTQNGRIVVPPPSAGAPPEWVSAALADRYGADGLAHGTVVLIDKVDRLSWKTAAALQPHLVDHFGVVYRNYLSKVSVAVQGEEVTPIDPLFLTPGHRFYDLDEVRAKALPETRVRVTAPATGKDLGAITVRYAVMPKAFTEAKQNGSSPRLDVLKAHNGLIVLRDGRQIDVVTKCPWTSFGNNDRYWAVEIDFPPTLDEEFSVTTSKQQIGLSDRIWEILEEHKVYAAIQEMRRAYKEDKATRDAEREEDEHRRRASEQVMEEAERFRTREPEEDPERDERRRQRFDEEVERRQERSGRSAEEEERDLAAEVEGQRFRVVRESVPGGAFYRAEQMGGQSVLYLNTAHRFFSDLYLAPESTPDMRAGLEVLLFVLGGCEIDAAGDRRRFYEAERAEWSRRLNTALDILNGISGAEDSYPEEEAVPVAA